MKLSDLKVLEVYCDGGSLGNGSENKAYGSYKVIAVDRQGKRTVVKHINKVDLGAGTNNEAEWRMMVMALEYLHALQQKIKGLVPAVIYTDSALVVNQLNGTYRIKKQHLKAYYDKALPLYVDLADVAVTHTSRETSVEFLGH